MTVTLERRGNVAALTLDRPEKRNALTARMWREIPERLAEAVGDPSVRAILVRGAGGHFAAGADIGELETLIGQPDEAARFLDEMSAATAALDGAPRPVIAAIDGACVGAGLAVAIACDIRIAGRRARFAAPPAMLGLAYPHADTARLAALIGAGATKRLFLTAETIDAEEALRLGLIDALIDADFEATAYARAAEIAALSPTSYAAMLEIIDAVTAGQRAETPRTRALFLDAIEGPDLVEGLAAARARRKPDFGGA